jgi:hypothetical protein
MSERSEASIQQECFMWHWNTRPEERGRLFHVYNNGKNSEHGAVLKGMGTVSGVADLCYLMPGGRCGYIEMKAPGGRQSRSQKEWQAMVEGLGFKYLIATSLDEFKLALDTLNDTKGAG